MYPETGRRFGPYEMQSRLGGGGMGHVYRAWDARLHREVAIKLLQSEYAMPGMRERFLREARAASALNHPNICTIFDIGEQDGDPYLVMELLEGETLRDRILNRSLSPEEIICIGREVAEALGAAHAKGIVHRDVKPANIFLVDRPNATVQSKVLDFGLAKIEGGVLGARSGRGPDITTIGSTVGTLAYMSPEQARGETLDSRSDLFSLGVVLYEMATRHVPFQGATSALIFVKLLNHPPEPVRDWNEAIPRELEKIILKLMAKERTARFQTSQEVVEALNHLQEKGSSGGKWLRKAVSTVPLVRAPDPVPRDRRTGNRKNSDDNLPGPRDSPHDSAASPPPSSSPPSYDTPRPSNESPQFLRPVARMPRGENTSRPAPAPLADESSAEAIDPVPSLQASADNSFDDRSVLLSDASLAEEAGLEATLLDRRASDRELEGGQTLGKPRQRKGFHWTPVNIALLALALLAFVALLYLLLTRGHFGPAALTPDDTIIITEITNETGDKSLDGIIAQGLEIDLRQSDYLRLRSLSSFRIALHQRMLEGGERSGPAAAHDAAKRMNTVAYLIGSIQNNTAPYVIKLELRKTVSNDVLTAVEERVNSLQEIPGAIDRLAIDIRAAAGESSDSLAKTENPLSREGTANLEALHAFADGDTAEFSGKTGDALASFQAAAAIDPKFVQAQLRLVRLYTRMHAELAAADAARLAIDNADTTGERTRALAQFAYEMTASGDYARATSIIRHVLERSPHDPESLDGLARALRLQGHMGEALQAAEKAYAEDPLDPEAYIQAEDALIGLDRYDAAFSLETQVARIGQARPGADLTAAYLDGKQDAVDSAVAAFQEPQTRFRADWTYGIYLDNQGRLLAGIALWRNRAAAAQNEIGLESAGALLIAQGALDNALAGDCTDGLSMAREADDLPQGMNSLFDSGMAHALCGSAERATQIEAELQQSYPQSFAVTGYYLADLQAALALHAGDPEAALDALRPARQFDLISLTPYLRGRAHVALRQVQIGIVDFQTVLAHRGVTFVVGNDVYPIAEIGVARAFADTGDLGNSAQAYRRFLELWRNADTGQSLLTEAKLHAQ